MIKKVPKASEVAGDEARVARAHLAPTPDPIQGTRAGRYRKAIHLTSGAVDGSVAVRVWVDRRQTPR